MPQKKLIPKGLAVQTMYELIESRIKAVKNNPDLKVTNRWDLSDCFYNTRKKLDAMGYDTRKYGDRKKERILPIMLKFTVINWHKTPRHRNICCRQSRYGFSR